MAAAVHAEGQLQPQFCRLGRCASGLQRVAADQESPLLLQHRAHPREGLGQQLLLFMAIE